MGSVDERLQAPILVLTMLIASSDLRCLKSEWDKIKGNEQIFIS